MVGRITELNIDNKPLNNTRLEFTKDPGGTPVSRSTTPQGLNRLIKWKEPVRVVTTTNGALATAYENTDIVDGVTLATNDRILLKDQTAGAENGIYIVNVSGAPTREPDFDTDDEVIGSIILALEGTANGGKAWRMTNIGTVTIGTTALVFTEFGSGGSNFTDRIRAVPGLPQGTIASLDIHTMVTGAYQISGHIFLDGATEDEVNYRLDVPNNLASTPNLKVIIKVLTLGVDSPAAVTRWTLSGVGIADTEDADITFTAETAVDKTMPTTTESNAYVTINISSITLAAGDAFNFQLSRNSNHANDTFDQSVLVTDVFLQCDRTSTA